MQGLVQRSFVGAACRGCARTCRWRHGRLVPHGHRSTLFGRIAPGIGYGPRDSLRMARLRPRRPGTGRRRLALGTGRGGRYPAGETSPPETNPQGIASRSPLRAEPAARWRRAPSRVKRRPPLSRTTSCAVLLSPMPHAVIHKQLSIFLPLPEWRALREEAARQGVPITELCRRWMQPHIARLEVRRVP